MNVKIISDGSPSGTRVMAADGSAIEGLTGITFRAEIDDINRAELQLAFVEINAEAEARVFVRGKEVRRIEYADGSVDEYPARPMTDAEGAETLAAIFSSAP